MTTLEYAFLPAMFACIGVGFWLGLKVAGIERLHALRFYRAMKIAEWRQRKAERRAEGVI